MCITIESKSVPPRHLRTLEAWFKTEWGQVDPLVSSQYPPPLIAIDIQAELVGGLSFTVHALPETERKGVWINALFVAPSFRGKGIASKLIAQAELLSRDFVERTLYVYTNVPQLYIRRGWTVRETRDDHFVLAKSLFGG